MKESTRKAVEALLEIDETLTDEERAQWKESLENDTPAPSRPKIVRFPEAKKITGLSRTTLQALADRGELQRVYTSKGRERCAGITLESLEAWLDGRSETDAKGEGSGQ